jgi:hypothetical protein
MSEIPFCCRFEDKFELSFGEKICHSVHILAKSRIMRNRAKCALCKDVLESFHETDYVSCRCGEISITGGMHRYECAAKSFANFLRVDDQDNEIVVKEMKGASVEDPSKKSRKDLKVEGIKHLERLIENRNRLPANALNQPVNHYDFYDVLEVLVSVLKED